MGRNADYKVVEMSLFWTRENISSLADPAICTPLMAALTSGQYTDHMIIDKVSECILEIHKIGGKVKSFCVQ